MLHCGWADICIHIARAEKVARNYIGVKVLDLSLETCDGLLAPLLVFLVQFVGFFNYAQLIATIWALHFHGIGVYLPILVLLVVAVCTVVALVLVSVFSRLLYFQLKSLLKQMHTSLKDEL